MSLLDPVMRQVLAQSQEPRRRLLDWLTALERVSRATSIVGHLLIGFTMGRTACFGHAAEPYGSWSLYHAGRQKRALKLGLARGGRIAVASTERGRGALMRWRRGATPSPGRAGIR